MRSGDNHNHFQEKVAARRSSRLLCPTAMRKRSRLDSSCLNSLPMPNDPSVFVYDVTAGDTASRAQKIQKKLPTIVFNNDALRRRN